MPRRFLTDEDEKKYVQSVNGETPDETGNVKIPLDGYVKSVNGVAPDKNGNVEITIPEGGDVDLTGYVQSVNGATPDENGNVDVTISDEQIGSAVSAYLDEHPETVTAVQDGSITEEKLSADVRAKLNTGGGYILGNTTQAEGSASFAEMFQKVKNEVMLDYMGNINKIPVIAYTDPHGALNASTSIVGVFETVADLVNWNDISKVISLGDCVAQAWKDASDIPWLACTELENMVTTQAPIPLEKQLNVFGNHDRMTWDSSANTYGEPISDQSCLQQYFRNITAHRRSNNGWFTVEDGYFNVKYIVTSAYEDTSAKFASTAQFDFLISELGKDDGYDVVLIAHELYNPDYNGRVFPTTGDMIAKVSAENDNSYGMGLDVGAILTARRNKTAGTFTDASGVVHDFDFSGCKTELLCSLHGHTHYETYNYVNDSYLNVALSPMTFSNRWMFFCLIDRENQKLKVWKMPTASSLSEYTYEKYEIPFDVSDRESFTIKAKLLNCTVFNTSITIKEGQPYSQYVKASSGYSLGDVLVTMDDTDVTADCYDATTGLIHIESVSGDIVVKAVDSTGDISQNFYAVTAHFAAQTGYVSKTPGNDAFTLQSTVVGDDGSYAINEMRAANGYLPKLSVVMGSEDITHDVSTWSRARVTVSISPVTDDVIITMDATPVEYLQAVINADGTEEESAEWYTSEYLDVSMYDSLSVQQYNMGTWYVALYDANKEFVTRLTAGTIYIGANVKYIRLVATCTNCAIIDKRESVSYAIDATSIADGLAATNADTSIKAGSSYENIISISSEEIISKTVTVTMGGTDITSDVYSDGRIYIPYVTGDIVITTAAIKEIMYEVQDLALDGTEVDTGIALMDVDKDYSIVVDFTLTTAANVFGNYVSTNAIQLDVNGNKMRGFFSGTWSQSTIPAANVRCKAVLTHTAGSGVGKWTMASSSVSALTYEATATRSVLSAYTIKLGSGSVGTINDFKIYGRVLTDEEVAEYVTFE